MKPVILIPGLMGSVIRTVRDQETIWPAVTYNTLKRLAMNPDGSQVEDNRAFAVDIIRSAAGRGIYRPAIQFFTENGYREGVDFFPFYYDWRKDVKLSALNLASKIEEVKHQTGYDQVSLVAHSMGGLVASAYLSANEGNYDQVENLIMVGTPMVGAPKSYLSLRFGMESPIPSIVPFSPTKSEFRNIVSNMPGAYQLLPSHRFEAFNGGGFVYQGGQRLNIGETYLDQDPQFNIDMAEQALMFHQNLDKNRDLLKQKSFLLEGTGLLTVKTITMSEDGTFISMAGGKQGDGTVLNLGLRDYLEPRSTVLFDEVEHLDLIRNDDVLNTTFNIIQNGYIS